MPRTKQSSRGRGAAGGSKRKATSSRAVAPKPFRFLDLPQEIRLQVYDLVFPARRGFVRFFDRNAPDSEEAKPSNVKINLLFICRQVYQEALPSLYSVNTFCIMPVLSKPFSRWNDSVELAQNTKWLDQAPHAGLHVVKKMELRLPATGHPPLSHFKDMSDMFPGLETMTLFIDSHFTDVFMFGTRPKKEDHCAYYKELKKLLPSCSKTVLDLKWLGDDESSNGPSHYKDLADAIRGAFIPASENKVEDGRSIFMLQEERFADKFDENQDAVMEFLVETVGSEAEDWQFELGYWGVRGEGGFGEDSEEEDVHYKNWNLIDEAARTFDWFTGNF